jgi:hypothetical protein
MTAFTVYIDESGDEGFTFRPHPHKGSSDWFILTAVVTPTSEDKKIRELAAQIRAALALEPKSGLHFSGLDHPKRVRAIQEIAGSHVRISSVLVNKHAITQPEIFSEAPFRLYFYTARLLLERISWYCRDNSWHLNDGTSASGDISARIIFEHRKRLSYDELRDYVQTLQQNSQNNVWLRLLQEDVRIDWRVVCPTRIEAAQKNQYAGLQIADMVAGGLRAALEHSRFANTEHRYAKMLAPVTYGRGSNFTSYGLKFFPNAPAPDDPIGHWVRKHYK